MVIRAHMMENKEPSTDSMASQTTCYYSNCDESTKWSVASLVDKRNPNGSHLTLSTCDDHYATLTGDLRRSKTRYTLLPINGPHLTPPSTPEDEFSEGMRDRSFVVRAMLYGAVVVTGVIIGPFLFVYYGYQWLFRGKKES